MRLPPVRVTVSGMPVGSLIKWCLLPGLDGMTPRGLRFHPFRRCLAERIHLLRPGHKEWLEEDGRSETASEAPMVTESPA